MICQPVHSQTLNQKNIHDAGLVRFGLVVGLKSFRGLEELRYVLILEKTYIALSHYNFYGGLGARDFKASRAEGTA